MKKRFLETPFEQSILKLTQPELTDYTVAHLRVVGKYFRRPQRQSKSEIWADIYEIQLLLSSGFVYHKRGKWQPPLQLAIERGLSSGLLSFEDSLTLCRAAIDEQEEIRDALEIVINE